VTASLKFGIKTSEFGSAGVSGRTGENVWDKVLIYEPGQGNGNNSDGAWDTETITYMSGRWWFFDRVNIAASIGTPLTLADMSTSGIMVGGRPISVIFALISDPGAIITSVQFGVGSGNAGANVYVNQLETNFYRAGDITTFGGSEPTGGSVTGMSPTRIICYNTSKRRSVLAPPATPWDCEAAGLVVDPGDGLSMYVYGTVTGSPVGGAVQGVSPITFIRCTNLSTGQRVYPPKSSPFDCSAAGLVTSPGQSVRMTVSGTAG
jgi:hypothetical protein